MIKKIKRMTIIGATTMALLSPIATVVACNKSETKKIEFGEGYGVDEMIKRKTNDLRHLDPEEKAKRIQKFKDILDNLKLVDMTKIDLKPEEADGNAVYGYEYLFENTGKKYTFDEAEIEHENPATNNNLQTFSIKENVGKFIVQMADVKKEGKEVMKMCDLYKIVSNKEGVIYNLYYSKLK